MPVQSEHVGTVTMRKTFAMDDGDDDPDDATSNNFLRVQAAYILRVDMDKYMDTTRLFDLCMFLVEERL